MKKESSVKAKTKEYFERIKHIFPELNLSSSFSMYNGDYPRSAKIELSNQSLAFKNKFNYTGHIIHYTSLESVLNIFNTESLRLYNCHNLNDDDEIAFATRKLGITVTQEEIDDQKKNFFVLSACKYDMTKNDEDFNLWRLYANSGQGAAIVFEITNISDDWQNIFYGQVSYDFDNQLNKDLLNFIQIHNQFNEDYKLFQNIPSIITAISLLFKSKIWSIENEIRLTAFCPFNDYSLSTNGFSGGNAYLSNTLKHTLNKFGNRAAYVELPLNIPKLKKEFSSRLSPEDINTYLSCIPHLKVKRVILGHKISTGTFTSLHRLLCESFAANLGYEIELGYSDFHRNYKDKIS